MKTEHSTYKDIPQEHGHCCRVAAISYYAALATGKDEYSAYMAGFMHDLGKHELPDTVFHEGDISPEEYETIKKHAVLGYETLKCSMLFSALCAGLHHRMAKGEGYGICLRDLPEDLTFNTIKKLLDIATIVSIADFVDAYTTRETKILVDESAKPIWAMLIDRYVSSYPLRELLIDRYPDEASLIDRIISINNNQQIFWRKIGRGYEKV